MQSFLVGKERLRDMPERTSTWEALAWLQSRFKTFSILFKNILLTNGVFQKLYLFIRLLEDVIGLRVY